MFSSAWTEWGHLANPQLAWHSHRQEPVALRSVSLHSSNSNAGMKWSYTNFIVNEACSGQQETSSRNLKS